MKLGMTLPTMVEGLTRDDLLHWCERIDAGPFASVAVGERIAFPNHECLVSLSAAAALTRKVRVIATIFVAPMHAGVWLAKQAATLDVLSGGRFVLGVGVGGREQDYRAVGAPFERRYTRMEEQVDLARRIWRGEAVVDGEAVGPAPVQAGGPPVWIAALGERALRCGARFADGLAGWSIGPDLEAVEKSFRGAEAAWKAAGRSERPYLETGFWYGLGPGAEERMDAYVARYLAPNGPQVVAWAQRRMTATHAASIRESLRRIEDLGADEVILVPISSKLEELERLLDVIA